MSARQAFIPRPASCTPSSDTHPHPVDGHEKDGGGDMFVNENGKARSIAAFFGSKRGTGTDAAPQGAHPTQAPSLPRANSSGPRRSFEGILRPAMTPMSIIPYPTTAQQHGQGSKQPGAGTPRKTAGQGTFEFANPMTPVSIPRGVKKGFGNFAGREKETTSNGDARASSIMLMGSGGEAEVRVSAGTEIGGYMRMFEGPGGGRNAVQSSLGHDIVAPVPLLLGGPDASTGDVDGEADGIFVHSSRSVDASSETEVGTERGDDLRRNITGTKRGMRPEDVEKNGWYADDDWQAQGSRKRMKQVQHDPDHQEYLQISSPHIPPTPAITSPSINVLDPSLLVGELFENIEEHINLEEIEANWKRWRECSREDWLKGADKLAQDYTDILNMVKDHLTEKVMAYASMISSVEERRTEVNRNVGIIHSKGNIVRENISRLGTKK